MIFGISFSKNVDSHLQYMYVAFISNSNANSNQNQSHMGVNQSFNGNQGLPNQEQGNFHSRSPSLPPGFMNNSGQNFSQSMPPQGQFFVQNPQVPNLQRHNSTGSQHFLVNERGEIVGLIPQGSFGGFVQGELGQNFSQPQQQRANSYGGVPGPYNPNHQTMIIQSQGGQQQQFQSLPVHKGSLQRQHSNPLDGNNTNDGSMQHQRHHTEPVIPQAARSNDGSIVSLNPEGNEEFELSLAGENIQGIDEAEEESRSSIRAEDVVSTEETSKSTFSYASTLMKAPPNPTPKPSTQLPTAGANITKSGPKLVYNVKFKRSQRNFILGQRITRDVKLGCYVKVEADRGEDLGIVFSIVSMEKYLASNRSKSDNDTGSGEGPDQPAVSAGDLKRIMRVATNDEISLLEVKREDEDALLKICRTKAHQRGLPMTVVDAEYQFDRNKLTFFFEADTRIDFRELVRDLFSIYKTRIWMQQLDKGGGTVDSK